MATKKEKAAAAKRAAEEAAMREQIETDAGRQPPDPPDEPTQPDEPTEHEAVVTPQATQITINCDLQAFADRGGADEPWDRILSVALPVKMVQQNPLRYANQVADLIRDAAFKALQSGALG